MRELSIEEKAKAYDEAYKKVAVRFGSNVANEIFLKESEDERIMEALIYHYQGDGCLCTNEYRIDYKDIRAWLEKQGELKPIGKLQLSKELYEHIRNTCACIDDALSSGTLADMKDYLSMAKRSANSAFDMIEKQGEKKPQGKTALEAAKEEKVDNQICVKPADKVEPKFKVGDWVVTDKGDIIQIVTANFDYYTINNGMTFSMSYVDKYWHLWTIEDAKNSVYRQGINRVLEKIKES